MLSTHLDERPEAALLNVVRHLSSTPRKVDWTKHLKPDHALLAVNPSCPLSSVARSAFSTINTEDFGKLSHSREHALLVTEWLQSAYESLIDLTLGCWLKFFVVEKGRCKMDEDHLRRMNTKPVSRLR